MLDNIDLLSMEKNSPPKSPAAPVIIEKNIGVWKMLTMKEPVFSLAPLLSTEWEKYTSAIPYVYQLVKDVYSLSPSLVLFFVASRVWRSIEPGINLHISSQLFLQLEMYLQHGNRDPAAVLRAIGGHLLCVVLSSLFSTACNQLVPKVASRSELFFTEYFLNENLRYDVHTLSYVKKRRNTNPAIGWYVFSELVDTMVNVLGLFTIVTSIVYQRHGGPFFTTMCLIYPFIGRLVRYEWSQATVVLSVNSDYLRLAALSELKEARYREDIVNNNIASYIMKEYKKSRERLGSLFTGDPVRETRITNSAYYHVFRSLSAEIPVLYFTGCALLDPASHSMSMLAILRQQSSTLTKSFQSTLQMFSGILFLLERVKDLYYHEPLRMIDGNLDYQPQEKKGMSFELRDVSFIYPGSQAKDGALKNVSIKVNGGQLVVIVGSNGSGKSTFLKLLTRIYDVTSGEILLDDIPIQSYAISSLRGATAILNQDHELYPLSLAENIGFGYAACAQDISLINKAVEKGGAEEVISRFKDGLATNLEPVVTANAYGIELPRHQALQDVLDGMEVSSKVSGGEKQRLVASRTFMRLQDPGIKFVAVDEPSSALDPRGELELFNRLRAEQDGKTMIFVTHRFGHLTKYADLIICMRDGAAIESGSHKDLLALNGEYAALYNIQAQAFSSHPSRSIGMETPPNIDNDDKKH